MPVLLAGVSLQVKIVLIVLNERFLQLRSNLSSL